MVGPLSLDEGSGGLAPPEPLEVEVERLQGYTFSLISERGDPLWRHFFMFPGDAAAIDEGQRLLRAEHHRDRDARLKPRLAIWSAGERARELGVWSLEGGHAVWSE